MQAKRKTGYFHNWACLFFASLQRLVLWAQRYPGRLFSQSRKGNSKTKQYEGGRTMKSMYRAALMVAAFVFLLPLSARSEIRAGSFEVGPFAGYNFFENSQNLENRPVVGLRLGYNFTRHFGIEGAGEFIKSRVDDKATMWTQEGQFTSPIEGVDLTFYHLDIVYHFM